MLAKPSDWKDHYHGDKQAQQLQRHFSYSDRIRYYWAQPDVEAHVEKLMAFFEGRAIPETLILQYLPSSWQAVVTKDIKPDAHELVMAMLGPLLKSTTRPPTKTDPELWCFKKGVCC